MRIQSILKSIRQSIEEESVSFDQIIQLESIARSNPRLLADDPRLAEWAGMPEEKWRNP